MKIREIKLTRFKRFSDTKIIGIPPTVRLVMIAGPNGCGKSSVFEAFNVWSRRKRVVSVWEKDRDYYVKPDLEEEANHTWNRAVSISFHDGEPTDPRKVFYIRSAHRNDPEFQLSSLARVGSALEEDRLPKLIQNDATVTKNYQRLAGQAVQDIFEKENAQTTVGDFRKKVIGEIKDAVLRLFPDLEMNSLGNPLTEGTFKFDKGIAKSFTYRNLSGGEKAAFDLLLDLTIKRREFDQTIFCIDEPEAHIATKLQGALLEELYRAVGSTNQLWLATHSAGMMRRARDIEAETPGTVAFLDFGGDRDFDLPQEVVPEAPTRVFWQRVLNVAFDDFAALMLPAEVVICEGRQIGLSGPSAGVDAQIYDRIFEDEFPDTRFVTGGSARDVENDSSALMASMRVLVGGADVRRLIDRDDLSDDEVRRRRMSGVSVLGRRNIECYLYDDEVISSLYRSRERPDLFSQAIAHKASLMCDAASERGRAPDDINSIAGPLMEKIKRDLGLTQSGGTPKEFARTVLAPLITRETVVYQELKRSVFDRG